MGESDDPGCPRIRPDRPRNARADTAAGRAEARAGTGAGARARPPLTPPAAAVTIRAARRDDLDTIADLLNTEIAGGTASWTETPKTAADLEQWFAVRTAAGHPVLVAEAGGRFLGFASYGPFRPGEGYRPTVEHSVYVAQAARRQGVARALMARLVGLARAAGLRRMVGGIGADQAASLALHRSLGFEPVGRLDGIGEKHGRRLDLCLVMLRLDAPGG